MHRKSFIFLALFIFILLFSPRVYAADNYTGDVSYYVQQGTTTSIQSGYQSNMSGLNIAFPTQNYFTLNKRNLYYYFIKEIDVVNSTYSFQSNHTYNIKFKFTFGSYIQRAISINNGISPSYGPVTYCNYGTCTKTSSCSSSPDNTCTWSIIYNSDTTHTGLTISFGSIYDVDKYIFWNNSDTYDQGIRLDLASIEDTTQSVDLSPIIDNDNQNTQNIINNNNTNTQNIINNQNANTEKEIESQKVCKIYNKSNIYYDNSALSSVNGSIRDNVPNFGVSNYISLDSTTTVKVLSIQNDSVGCFYDTNKNYISCVLFRNFSVDDTISIPNNADYFRFMIQKSNDIPRISVCKNGNQALSDDINDLNNSLTDSNVVVGGELLDVEWYENSYFSSIITSPIQFLNSLNGQCSPVVLPLFGKNISLPCGTTIFWDLDNSYISNFRAFWNLLFGGLIIYRLALSLIMHINNALDPTKDEIGGLDI